MKLYTINEEYINFLKIFSENVKYNKNESRPYVGIVLKINEYNYFAPLGSPKLKHITMKESLDFVKIDYGTLGVINLNNMIPVPLEEINKIDFSKFDKKYQELLKDQARWIYENTKKINKKSCNLYRLITTKENTIFHKRSNNFKFLEKKMSEYISTKN
ncbi:MAG: type III toxin-antitoxin system ToxN/AbiQ family toxin [Fusobacterium sp.]